MTTPSTFSPLLEPLRPPAEPIPFALAGWGWRARQFATIAERLPAWFRLTGILRQTADGTEPAPVATDLAGLLAARPAFVVLAVPRTVAPALTIAATEAGVPVLVETPPAAELDGIRALWAALAGRVDRVHVAEQYPSQPYHAALRALVRAGRLGPVTHAQASVGHDYHGIAVLRALLGAGRDAVRVHAHEVDAPIMNGPSRSGPAREEGRHVSRQLLAWIDFGEGRSGVHDFVGDQYMSWIRANRVVVRGERGEVVDDRVAWLEDFRTPARGTLERFDGGQGTNLQGLSHQGYALGGQWLYRNPFWPAPLPDDFIAMATLMRGMGELAGGGAGPYALADGCHDHAIGLAMAEAARSGTEVVVAGEPWMA